jgi:hypothetical protein
MKVAAPTTRSILSKIYFVRGHKIMLDEDLAEMYNVETRRLNEQVKRNINRFPKDFMFRLTEKEYSNLMSQFAISSSTKDISNWGGRRKMPLAFTEHGVLMLSSVLNSEVAIKVNIQIMRVYSRIRNVLIQHKDILLKLKQMEKRIDKNDGEIQAIFRVLHKLIGQSQKIRPAIGFRRPNEKS